MFASLVGEWYSQFHKLKSKRKFMNKEIDEISENAIKDYIISNDCFVESIYDFSTILKWQSRVH